jgi:hypothetical protein
MNDADNATMEIHHKYQVLRHAPDVPGGDEEIRVIDQIMGSRFQKELEPGINVHAAENLAAVPHYVHGKITAQQQKYWNKKFKEAGFTNPTPADREMVYENADINEYKEFCDNLDKEYKDYYLAAGSSRKDFKQLRNQLETPEGKQTFDLEEAKRRTRLFPQSLNGPGVGMFFLFFIQPRIDQLEGIRNHTPLQLAAYNNFVAVYASCVEEIDSIHRLTEDSAFRLMNAFKAYVESLQLDQGMDDWFAAFEAEVTKYILTKFD